MILSMKNQLIVCCDEFIYNFRFIEMMKCRGVDMIGFIIWSIVAIVFIGIGISAYKSEKTVGFFTFVESPVVNNVKKYNHAVSILWIVGAVLLEMTGIPLLVLEQNSPMFITVIFGVVVLVIGMMIVYVRIEHKYRA